MKECSYLVGNNRYSYEGLLGKINGNENLLALDISKIKDIVITSFILL